MSQARFVAHGGKSKIIRKYYAARLFGLSNSNAGLSYLTFRRRLRPRPAASVLPEHIMQDLFWTGTILALLAASLGYARLCDDA